ncbi:MAG: hypothetical protein M0R06_01510 [Sphaerochaeta sp.]|jgi:hypothetical protein|nr:hypothetical protein [Sphaerochaeta sp.]
MRLYGGKIIRRNLDRRISESREFRDGIVWDVNTAERYCRVKIQGSDTYVKAFYPENWESTPQFLKPGNVVRIAHPGGNKARIEVVGHGFLLPTAVPGGSGSPTPATAGDAVITDCTLSPSSPVGMSVIVAPGTYRISGVIYTLFGMVMDRSDLVMDQSGLIMDEVGGTAVFDAASGSLFRYDTVCVGSDGVIDVVKGTNFAETVDPIPSPPLPSADHVSLGWVLIYPNMTEVTTADINRVFTEPTASELRITIGDQNLAWGESTTMVTVAVYDQYGNYKTRGGAGYHVDVDWQSGNGTLNGETGDFSFYMTYIKNMIYTRGGLDTDVSPTFYFEESEVGLGNGAYILLWSDVGELGEDPVLMFGY